MKKGAQKEKGHAYERVVAEKLTKVYYPDNDGEFRRVPQSGGWDKRVVSGDLVPFRYHGDELIIDTSFPFSVECKNWVDIKHFFSGLYSAESQMFDWMSQCIEDSEITRRMALVVFKLYRQNDVCILLVEHFNQLREMFGQPVFKFYRLERWRELDERCGGPTRMVFCLLDEFTDWIDWGVYKMSGKTKYIRSIMSNKGDENEGD